MKSTPALLPLTVDTAPEGSRAALTGVQKGFGFIPNLMGTFANSPSVLNGYLALDSHWEKSTTKRRRERRGREFAQRQPVEPQAASEKHVA